MRTQRADGSASKLFVVRYLSLLGTCRQAGEGVITSTWAAAQMLVPQPLRSSTMQYDRREKQRRNDDAGDQQTRGC